MSRFQPKTIIVLKRESPENPYWRIKRGGWFRGIWRAWQRIYKDIDDKGRITKIEITVTREKADKKKLGNFKPGRTIWQPATSRG